MRMLTSWDQIGSPAATAEQCHSQVAQTQTVQSQAQVQAAQAQRGVDRSHWALQRQQMAKRVHERISERIASSELRSVIVRCELIERDSSIAISVVGNEQAAAEIRRKLCPLAEDIGLRIAAVSADNVVVTDQAPLARVA